MTKETYGEDLVEVARKKASKRRGDFIGIIIIFAFIACVWGGCSYMAGSDERMIERYQAQKDKDEQDCASYMNQLYADPENRSAFDGAKTKCTDLAKVYNAARSLAAKESAVYRYGAYMFGGGAEVSKETFIGDYPLVVPGNIRCQIIEGNRSLFLQMPSGKTYQLNGYAAQYHEDLKAIWQWAPGSKTMRIDVGPLIEIAEDVCRLS